MDEAFARTAQEQLLGAETLLTRDLEADPVEAIHTARKSIKKERSRGRRRYPPPSTCTNGASASRTSGTTCGS